MYNIIKNKRIRINLTEEFQNLFSQNNKTLFEEIFKDPNKEKVNSSFMDQKV